GDYSETGQTDRYPAFEGFRKQEPTKGLANATFGSAIDNEIKRRQGAREGKPLSDSMVRKLRMLADEFSQFRGAEDVVSVTPQEVDEWKDSLLEEGRLSSKTIRDRLTNLRAVLGYAQAHAFGTLFPDGNPVDRISLPASALSDSASRTYTLVEARAILQAARKETKPERRWLHWLLAYSGARVEELVGLSPSDVREIEGHWFASVHTEGQRTLKNAYAIRMIPVHPDVIAEGFLGYVTALKNSGEERLFPKSAAALSRNWIRNTVGIQRPNVPPHHGWRHLFEDRVIAASIPSEAKNYITGRTTGGSAERYGKSEALLPELARLMAQFPSYLH
ncbi:MAG: hypothetical protein AAFY15_10495, partial [Cyanobacteria bacterium J06648_11]